MSMERKLKTRGILLLVSFFVVLVIIFMPVFPGKVNGLDYMDNLFNMISKGSSYFIPAAIEESASYDGKAIEVTIEMADAAQAEATAGLFRASGAEVTVTDNELVIAGDVGAITRSSLEDSDLFYQNQGQPVADRYGFSERQVMYYWWESFKEITLELNKQSLFAEAKFFAKVQMRALEPAYNYYGIEAIKWQDHIVLILVALTFYVVYTLWYGFGIMYLFEGMGLKISH